MKRVFMLLLIIVFSALMMQGCSGNSGGGSSVDTQAEVQAAAFEVGYVGDLIDLGDLFEPLGDHWYFTWARGINEQGTVIGQSNKGDIVRAAFKWEPADETMTFLGIHPEFIYSQAVDINATGSIIGYSSNGVGWPNEKEQIRAFLWESGDFIDLPPVPGYPWSKAVDINNNGEVVFTMSGGIKPNPSSSIALYWDGITYISGVPAYKPLGGILGAPSAEAVAINENGQVVINSGGNVVFYDLNWDIIEVLGQLPGDGESFAVDINDSGYVNNDGIPDGHVIGNSGSSLSQDVLFQILSFTFFHLPEVGGEEPTIQGMLMTQGIVSHGFFWDGGAMYPVDHLGGGQSIAADINDNDQVVGGALTADDKTHAFLWTLGPDKKGTIRDLGTLGGDNSFALAITKAGQVVGWAETGEFYEEEGVVRPVRHAFLWEDGNMYDLGTHDYFYDYPFIPPYPFSVAVDVAFDKDLGELFLTGNSVAINSHPRGFFLNPEMP